MTKENRAWFVAEDGRAPQSFWVMMDQTKWVNIDFMQGKMLDVNEIGAIMFNVKNNKWANVDYIRTWDFLPNNIWAPLANERALKLLEDLAPGEFQAIPTEVIMPDGYVIKEYKLINVIKKVQGLLLDHSIIDPRREFDDFGLMHYSIVYHKLDVLGELNLAREQKLDVAVLYCSDKLRKAIKSAKLTGLVFKNSHSRHEFWTGK